MPTSLKSVALSALLIVPTIAMAAPVAAPPGVTQHRAAVIKDCVAEGAKLSQRDFGVRQLSVERACMVARGELE